MAQRKRISVNRSTLFELSTTEVRLITSDFNQLQAFIKSRDGTCKCNASPRFSCCAELSYTPLGSLRRLLCKSTFVCGDHLTVIKWNPARIVFALLLALRSCRSRHACVE